MGGDAGSGGRLGVRDLDFLIIVPLRENCEIEPFWRMKRESRRSFSHLEEK